jgi:outer membrane protein assembly factor BamB
LTAVPDRDETAARADDWAQWRGPTRTGHVPDGVPVPKSFSASPQILWRIPIGNGVASPIVGGGKCFYLDNQDNKEVVHAVDAATGKELWHAILDDVHKDGQSPPGPRCTPTGDGDRVYAQSCRGELRCYNAADGTVLWQTNFVKDFGAVFIGEKGNAMGATRHGYTGSPIVDGDHLIAEVGGKNAGIVCFDKLTGKVIWQSQSNVPAYAAPMIGELAGARQIVAFMADAVIGVDPADGKLLWNVPVKTSLARHVTTPVIVDDLVMIASHQVGLIGIKVAKEGDAFKATKAWTAPDAKINFSSPVAVGNALYGVGPSKDLICIDAKSGAQKWSKQTFISDADKAYAGIIAMGETLLVLTDDGQLVLIAADPKDYKELSRARVCGKNWCNPAYANGKLYLRDAKELVCVQLLP